MNNKKQSLEDIKRIIQNQLKKSLSDNEQKELESIYKKLLEGIVKLYDPARLESEKQRVLNEINIPERQFVFNQLFMDYLRMNSISSQGQTYEEILPNILEHYYGFEWEVSNNNQDSSNLTFIDQVNDYLIHNVRQYSNEEQKHNENLENLLSELKINNSNNQ